MGARKKEHQKTTPKKSVSHSLKKWNKSQNTDFLLISIPCKVKGEKKKKKTKKKTGMKEIGVNLLI